LRALAAAAFVAIFVFGIAFPIIILAAGLIGYAGARARYPAFLGADPGAVGDSLLGEDASEHAARSGLESLKIAGF
jgi:chromate transporter